MQIIALDRLYLKLFVTGLLLVIIGLNVRNPAGSRFISKIEISNVRRFLEQSENKRFVNYRSSDEFGTIFQRNTVFNQPLPFLSYLANPYVNVSLNVHDIKLDTTSVYKGSEEQLLHQSPFWLYHQKNKNLSFRQSADTIVLKGRFPFVCVSPNTLIPASLKYFTKDSISLSRGWKIYYVSSQ